MKKFSKGFTQKIRGIEYLVKFIKLGNKKRVLHIPVPKKDRKED